MKRIDAAVALLLAILAVAPALATQTEEDCPAPDPIKAYRFDRFPAEQQGLQRARFTPDDSGESQSAQEGIDHIVKVILTSHRSDCTPVRLVVVHGGADVDSRGTAFEDHVSVERAFQAMKELKAALEPARTAAVGRGEVRDLSVGFSFGGMGTRGAVHKNPTSESQRAENRYVTVRFAYQPAPAAEPSGETAPSGETSSGESSGD
jgi:hypothetical protein